MGLIQDWGPWKIVLSAPLEGGATLRVLQRAMTVPPASLLRQRKLPRKMSVPAVLVVKSALLELTCVLHARVEDTAPTP